VKRYYIDTNCLISFVTDRNISQQKRISPFIEDAAVLRHKLIITSHVITEFVYVCTAVYKLDSLLVRSLILDLLHTPGMEVVEEYSLAFVLHVWPSFISDYGDAVLAASVQKNGGMLLTFDTGLRKKCTELQIKTYAL
jgi:predicted nucleic-acid-binding protein